LRLRAIALWLKNSVNIMSEYLYITFKMQQAFNISAVQIGQQVQESIASKVPPNIHQHLRIDVRATVISAKKS
jgi:hypothetical protein